MFALFECVGQAVMNKGVRGICDFVPGAAYVIDVVGEAYRLLKERRKKNELREEIEKIAAASTDEARKVAAQVAKEVAADAKSDEQMALEIYLSLIPNAVRQSMKRADDPSGKTVPPDFALDSPADLGKLLPHRVPQFRAGADLPGRPGWQLTELLGAGGFGEVWLAKHTFIPHPRAVKFCTDPLVRTKLTSHEGKVIARVMAQGNHPNVVPLLDAVLDGETPWLMYEYVGGGCLTDLIHRWQALAIDAREAQTVAALHQLAAAVGTFHRLSPPIVHRDLKPANVLVEANGGSTLAVLRITDFGIGGVAVEYLRTNAPHGLSLMTGWLETSLRGSYTPLYASPQQRAGNPPDPRDDVHALGVIGFQMMTGRLTEAPGIDAGDDLKDAGASDGFITLMTKCVASRPDRRPKDAAELAERLAELKGAKPATAPASRAASAAGFREGDPTRPLTRHGSPRAAPTSPKVGPTPLEHGTAAVTVAPKPVVLTASKWPVPLRGTWFTRAADNPDAVWSQNGVKLPGEITAKPGEVYRIALHPDTTTDAELAKLRSMVGLPGLEAVDLTGCKQVTDAGLMHLAQLRGLKAIGLGETQVTDSGVSLLLTRFPDLEAVGLSGAENVSQTVVPYLARLRNLKVLALPPRADSVDVRVEFTRRRPACKLV